MNISETLQLGTQVEHRAVVMAPLFPRRRPGFAYITLGEALPLGSCVTEVDAAGSVPELLVDNPTAHNLLLYDGEELLGAKQNRILNVTVLVPPERTVTVPVSFVEQGRWSARTPTFSGAGHTAYPELRRRKAERQLATPLERGGRAGRGLGRGRGQELAAGSVLADGRAGGHLRGARRLISASSARRFRSSRGSAGRCSRSRGAPVCLDFVSDPAAFERLYPKLREGYLLDALEALDGAAAGEEALGELLAGAARAPSRREASIGLGEDLRLVGDGVIGSGLTVGDELVQLSVHAGEESGARATSISQPSRRR